MTKQLVRKYKGETVLTKAGRALLEGVVTDLDGPVYAFTGKANPLKVAAAMARLSRSPEDLRTILINEFGVDEKDAEALIKRVVTAYGDDSVAQLITISIGFEDASNLLTKQLEWGRLAAYLEQSTRYIFFDQKKNGGYRYHMPINLPAELALQYARVMDGIFDDYSELVHELTEFVRARNPRPNKSTDPDGHTGWMGATRAQACDAVRSLLPASTTSTVGIVGSAQAIDNLIKHLLADPLEEMRQAGRSILDQARKVAPAFFERTDREDRGLLDVEHRVKTRESMKEIASGLRTLIELSDYREDCAPVTLVNYHPRSEHDLAPRMLYAQSGYSLGQLEYVLKRALNSDVKEQYTRRIMQAYFGGERANRRHKPGRAIEAAHFEWELVGDYGTFRDLQRHRMVDAWEWPELTPHIGYDVPDLVREAGMSERYVACMEASAALYEQMKAAGFASEAQYALCMGFKMRYSFITNLRELFHMLELRTSPQGHPGYRKLCNEMYRQLRGVYPLSAAAMRFVNQSDNLDELTRMASERETARKLAAQTD